MNPVGKVLVIEDDPGIANVIRDTLLDAGYLCELQSDGIAGLQTALHEAFDLIILDLNLPSLGGLDICRRIKQELPRLPIIMLTARTKESDVVSGLEVGADDYVRKPFQPLELLARVRVRLRDATARKVARAESVPAERAPQAKIISIGELQIDEEKARVLKNGEVVELTVREFQLVALLATHPGRPFSRDQILELVWDLNAGNYEVNVTSFISRIRKKLETDPNDPKYVLTVRGLGYRFAEPNELSFSPTGTDLD